MAQARGWQHRRAAAAHGTYTQEPLALTRGQPLPAAAWGVRAVEEQPQGSQERHSGGTGPGRPCGIR